MNNSDPVIIFPGRTSHTRHSQRSGHGPTGSSLIYSTSSAPCSDAIVSFQRQELNLILSRYGVMVSKGTWRDYAIDMGKDCAIFSIFRHTSEHPLYRIEKNPKMAKKQGAYRVLASDGKILKRGHELAQVLKLFDKKLELVEK